MNSTPSRGCRRRHQIRNLDGHAHSTFRLFCFESVLRRFSLPALMIPPLKKGSWSNRHPPIGSPFIPDKNEHTCSVPGPPSSGTNQPAHVSLPYFLPLICCVIVSSLIFSSSASRNALLKITDSVRSPSNGNNTFPSSTTPCFGTMHKY